jgi:predicted phosphodiesterase
MAERLRQERATRHQAAGTHRPAGPQDPCCSLKPPGAFGPCCPIHPSGCISAKPPGSCPTKPSGSSPPKPPAASPAKPPTSEGLLTPAPVGSDRELVRFNVRLAKRRQALLDQQRIERKAFREHARIENAVSAYARELGVLLDERGFTQEVLLSDPAPGGEAVLIVQLSDLHFNEQVDLPSNRYDFTVASARLAKLAGRIKQLGRSYGASKVVVACLGDFLNSDRRLDELLSNATNRSKATLLAVDILRAFLLDLRSEFTLEVYGITGNESRVKQELGWSDALATDSYDLMIYAILKRGFEGVDGIDFCGFQANELLFEVMGRTFLCLHGHQVGANVQKSVQEITGRHGARGITVDYTLFGHLHATSIGDYHARNASLVGSNAYSEAGLNYCSKAAQNVHIVTPSSIDGMKVDLQDTTGIEPYPFASEWEAYAPKSESKLHQGAVVYQVIV